MACWTVQEVSVQFNAENLDTLAAALQALGWQSINLRSGQALTAYHSEFGSLRYDRGNLTMNDYARSQIDTIKQEYTGQALKKSAGRFSWKVQETAVKKKVKA